MSVKDEDRLPWLREEKVFIERAIEEDKIVIGICLGAQLIAEVLGATVSVAHHPEIGWFPVSLLEAGKHSFLFEGFPKTFYPLHWHGETFGLPDGALRCASSEGCRNQAFIIDDRVLGLQFHLELGEADLQKLVQNCTGDLRSGRFIQNRSEILKEIHLAQSSALLNKLLDNLEERFVR